MLIIIFANRIAVLIFIQWNGKYFLGEGMGRTKTEDSIADIVGLAKVLAIYFSQS